MERNERNEGLREVVSKPRWTWNEAKVVLEALDRSGVSITAFCRKYKLNYFRVLQWNQRRRQEQSAEAKEQRFFPLQIIDEAGSKRSEERQSDWVVQIELSDCAIRISEGASEAIVSRAVRAVRGASC
jgi:hypothetical protein